jgi:uncharacterized membrane protein YqiK
MKNQTNQAAKTTKVFEGTIAGHKFLFVADKPELTPLKEVMPGVQPEKLAEEIGAEIIARSLANHEAVKSLMRQWIAAKKAERNNTPEALAQRKAKEDAKAAKAEEKRKARELAKNQRMAERAEKAKAKAEAKAEAAKAKAAAK